MDESPVRLDDMRLAAALVGAGSFTAIARRFGIPKQTVSRRVGQLESALGVRLVDRSTRAFRLTALGRGYAERCAEVIRAADEVNRGLRGEVTAVSGTLRITADPLFGEHFLPPVIAEFVRRHPSARVDVVLTSRFVDLVEEGFDLAVRIGRTGDDSLIANRIADATLAFVAAPVYLKKRGTPATPEALAGHDCVALAPEGGAVRWAFRDGAATAIRWLPLEPRIRVNHLALARDAALAGLGIANLPSFACAAAIARGTLRPVLADHVAAFGAISVVHPSRRLVTPRVRVFRDLLVEHLRARPELRA